MTEDRGDRLQIMLSEQEVRALDDWRFAKRMPSRASAVRELLRRGLSAEGFDAAEPGQKSQSYGVVDSPAPNRDAPEQAGEKGSDFMDRKGRATK